MIKTLTSAYAVGVMSRILAQLLTFVSVMVASRYIDLASFGAFILAWTVIVVINGLIYTGFYQALLRSNEPDHDSSSYFWLMGVVALGGALICLVLGVATGGWQTETGTSFLLLSPMPFLSFPTAWNQAHLVAQQRIRAASIYTLVAQTAVVTGTWVWLVQGYGILAMIAGYYVGAVVGLVITTALVRRVPRLELRRQALSDSRKSVPNLWGTSLLGMFSNYGADLILGAFLSPGAVGAYRGGSRITQTVGDFVLQPLVMLSWSRFSRAEREGNPDVMRISWIDNMAVAAALMWPMMLSLAMLAESMVSVIFEDTWLPAAGAVVILSASRAIRFFSSLLEPSLLCTGHNAWQMQIRLFGAALFLVTLLSFGRLSVELAAIAHLVTSAGIAVLAVWACARALKLSVSDLRQVVLPGLVIAAGCVGVVAALGPVRASMGVAPGLFLTIGALAVYWGAAMAVCLRAGWLRIPQP
ncbi:MAG: oligosaccharide flippase family protein [Paracoccaceae bacterium]